MKKLSIIIPVYNSEKFLSDCLDSILISDNDFEIILVDDGSKDSSSSICDEYSKNDSRVKVFHKENGGVSLARNYGISQSNGEYIMFVDSDDILLDGWDSIINFIEDDDIYYFTESISVNTNKDDLFRFIIGMNDKCVFLSGPYCKAFKTSFIKENNISFQTDIINGEDMIFNIVCLLNSKSYKIFNQSIYNYRQFIGQATKKFDSMIIKSDLSFHSYIDKILKKYKFDKKYISEIKDYFLEGAILLILNRISYIKNYNDAKKEYSFLDMKPYNEIINKKKYYNINNKKIFQLCRLKKYRKLYYKFKFKNYLSIIVKKIKKIDFVRI